MKKRILALIALLAGTTAISWTIAYSRDQTIFNNDFELAKGEVTYTETFKSPDNWKSCDEEPKELVITNNSDVPVNARFKMKGYWKKNGSTSTNQNNEISPVINGQEVAIVNFQNENDWEQKGEWYEYKNVLQKGESTSSLLKSVTLNCDLNLSGEVSYSQDGKTSISGESIYGNARYKLDLTAQTVASDQKAAAWSMATFAVPNNFKSLEVSKSIVDNIDSDGCGSYYPARNTYRVASCIKKFVRSDINPTRLSPVPTIYGFYQNPSNSYILGWVSSDYRTLYWYTEASEIYFPSNSGSLFYPFGRLESLSSFEDINTSQVESMHSIFGFIYHLSDVSAVANWDTSKVTNLQAAFDCAGISSFEPFRNWDVSRVTTLYTAFAERNRQDAISLEPLKDWSVSNVREYYGAFGGWDNIDASYLENWDVSPSASGKDIAFSTTAIKPSWAR